MISFFVVLAFGFPALASIKFVHEIPFSWFDYLWIWYSLRGFCPLTFQIYHPTAFGRLPAAGGTSRQRNPNSPNVYHAWRIRSGLSTDSDHTSGREYSELLGRLSALEARFSETKKVLEGDAQAREFVE